MNNSDRDVESARRAVAALGPTIRGAMANYKTMQSFGIQEALARIAAPEFQRSLANVKNGLAPVLQLEYATLFPAMSSFQGKVAKQINLLSPEITTLFPVLEEVGRRQREQLVDLLAGARRASYRRLPPNWPHGKSLIPNNLEALLLDEGLALAWVPPESIVSLLFKAESAAQRRKIIGRRWQMIGRACLVELDQIEDSTLVDYVGFAHEAAEALLGGTQHASQALSANLLDSIIHARFDRAMRKEITGRQERIGIESYPLRVAVVLAGIWGCHETYWPQNGDSIPRRYTRHASAHGVSRRQYSRINAVIALMHVVSLLRLLDTDLRD